MINITTQSRGGGGGGLTYILLFDCSVSVFFTAVLVIFFSLGVLYFLWLIADCTLPSTSLLYSSHSALPVRAGI